MTNIFQTALSEITTNIKKSQKSHAIRLYAGRFGRLLRSEYGKQATYTPIQVKTTIDEEGYNTNYESYGLAMYCRDLDFANYYDSIDESYNYQAMRSEIAECLFGANVEFNTSKLFSRNVRIVANGHHYAPDISVNTYAGYHDSGCSFGGDCGVGGDCGGGHF
jgi:hypothetical protein